MKRVAIEGIKVRFSDLQEEAQGRLYLDNPTKFEKDAANSQFDSVRNIVAINPQTKADTLDIIFLIEMSQENINIINLRTIFCNKNCNKKEKKYKMLSKAQMWNIRVLPVWDDETSSTFLNQMLIGEIKDLDDLRVEETIMYSKNFLIEEETIKTLKKSKNWKKLEPILKMKTKT